MKKQIKNCYLQNVICYRDASDYESDTEDDAKQAKASQNKK